MLRGLDIHHYLLEFGQGRRRQGKVQPRIHQVRCAHEHGTRGREENFEFGNSSLDRGNFAHGRLPAALARHSCVQCVTKSSLRDAEKNGREDDAAEGSARNVRAERSPWLAYRDHRVRQEAIREDDVIAPRCTHTEGVPDGVDDHARGVPRDLGDGHAFRALGVVDHDGATVVSRCGSSRAEGLAAIDEPAAFDLCAFGERVARVGTVLRVDRGKDDFAGGHAPEHRFARSRIGWCLCPATGHRHRAHEVHGDSDGRRRVALGETADTHHDVVHRGDAHTPQSFGHAGGNEAAALHGLDVLVGEGAVAIVFTGAREEIGRVCFGEGDKSCTRGGLRQNRETHGGSLSRERE